MKRSSYIQQTFLYFTVLCFTLGSCNCNKTEPEPRNDTSVSPSEGNAFTPVKITGTKPFHPKSTVKIDDKPLPETDYEVDDKTIDINMTKIIDEDWEEEPKDTEIEVTSDNEVTKAPYKIKPFLIGSWERYGDVLGGSVLTFEESAPTQGIYTSVVSNIYGFKVGDIEVKDVRLRPDGKSYDMQYLWRSTLGTMWYEESIISIVDANNIVMHDKQSGNRYRNKYRRK